MQKNIVISIVISAALIGGTLYFVSDRPGSPNGEVAKSQNVEIKGGIQYVTVTAKNGYSPRSTEIKGGVPTRLIMKTDGTYDCSASLIVRSVGFQKILQPTGEEIIDLGAPKSGEKVQGICGMGMFNFQLEVS